MLKRGDRIKVNVRLLSGWKGEGTVFQDCLNESVVFIPDGSGFTIDNIAYAALHEVSRLKDQSSASKPNPMANNEQAYRRGVHQALAVLGTLFQDKESRHVCSHLESIVQAMRYDGKPHPCLLDEMCTIYAKEKS